jgi:hypothetical protein
MSTAPLKEGDVRNYESAVVNAVEDAMDEYAFAKTGEDAKQFRDIIWMIIFYVHLVAVIVAIIINNVDDETDDQGNSVSHGLRLLFAVTAISSIAFSTAALAIMSFCLNGMIKAGLLFSVVMSLLVGMAGFMYGQIIIGIFGILSFLIGACYAKLVWRKIPFAEANLKTALVSVKANWGLGIFAYVMVIIAYIWNTFWFMGLGDSIYLGHWGLFFILIVSYYWVFNVLFNTLVVTTIGTIGTWWVAPEEASSCCSQGLQDSLYRASTYSFGSICLGSLLVAFIQALRALVGSVKNNDDCACLACILDCFLSCIEGALQYMNKVSYPFFKITRIRYVTNSRMIYTVQILVGLHICRSLWF